MRPLLNALVVLIALLSVACGGGQTAPATEAPAEAAAPIPPPAEEPEEVDDRIWYVYWDEIHSLSVYPQPGPIRSEEPENQGDPYGTVHEQFSIISSYYEKERFFAPSISAATDIDDLLARFAELEDVRIEEGVNPIYQY